MNELNKENIKEVNTDTKAVFGKDGLKWTPESIFIGIMAKKFGKNGQLSFELKKEDFPNSLIIQAGKDRVFVYAE